MPNKDPYKKLDVERTASEAEIKKAYRKLVKKLHPDINPGRADIERRFKEVTSAYELLSDSKKRARFDRGEIDADGNEQHAFHGGFGDRNPYGTHQRQRSSRYGPFSSGGRSSAAEDIFAEFFGGGKHGFGGSAPQQRGSDVTYQLKVSFLEACLGEKKRVALSSGKTIDVTIPKGTEDGHKLRLRGLGNAGTGGAGDALVEIKVGAHPYFIRKNNNILLDVPISLPEAILGGEIKVPTLFGPVSLKIPEAANTDSVMRLKGKGVPRAKGGAGDMLVKLKIVLPDNKKDLEKLASPIEKWAKKHAYAPRKKLGWA
ncbi:MAG TPA: molecular chaperone DnaJ [Rhodospirillaceae bacterium]|nr:molecular chaperone DnaJ [Rhodospirillaceae bacterium]